MVKKMNDLEVKIESLRRELHKKIEDNEGLLDYELIKLSQKLDTVLNERNRLQYRGE